MIPDVIENYLAAHDRGDVDGALPAFAAEATVSDDGHDYVDLQEIRPWLTRSSTEFTYTRTLVSAHHEGGGVWVVVNHLEGNFPGGQVDLSYRFVVQHDKVVRLVIALHQ